MTFDDLAILEADIAAGDAVAADGIAFVTDQLGLPLGDVTGDGGFGPLDLLDVVAAGLFNKAQEASYIQGDFNFDRKFGPLDLLDVVSLGHFDRTAASVPEPGGLLLIVLGTLTMIHSRRKR